MREIRSDIFQLARTINDASVAICVTTNGIIKGNGRAVMGAGIAKAFCSRIPDIDIALANHLRANGNVPGIIGTYSNCKVVSFPTKHNWVNPSDINLIKKSAEILMQIAEANGITHIYLPKPGCQCGRLSWDDVKPVIEPIFGDKVTIVTL